MIHAVGAAIGGRHRERRDFSPERRQVPLRRFIDRLAELVEAIPAKVERLPAVRVVHDRAGEIEVSG